ncbi:MAG TPA: 2-hydroxychromene-2-carboxylate isomerase [Thermodesulfobacteriota bacterium]|nr:2-hydroxychromene-2-carboxylate isomerase [Thermodesulfobacteriota bacterium]
MIPKGIQFWFEFASTYSYLSAFRIERLAEVADVPVEWKPFLLGPIFRSQGWNTSPFNIYPAKGRYMWRDIERLCEKYVIPFKKPTQFPRNGLLAARVACIAIYEGWCPEFTRAVFRANFADDRDISNPKIIAEILELIGKDKTNIIERAKSPENKEFLRKQTEEAINLGIFGAPIFVVGDELFWGNDRLEDAIEWYKKYIG